jgi:RND family efflux transporter MFP subunit
MKHLLVVVIAIILCGCLCSCAERAARADTVAESQDSTAADAVTNEPEVKSVNVKVEKISPDSLTEYVIANGVTKAKREVTYSAEIAGKLEYISADLGDKIEKGKVLARIDFGTLKAMAAQAEAAHDLAKSTSDRMGSLRGEDLVSQQHMDEASSNLRATEAQLSIARSNLAKSTVKSSMNGIVSGKYVEKSEYVGPGMRLYDIVDYSTIIVEAQLAESDVASVLNGAKVLVDIQALGQQFEGTVDTVIPTADKVSKTFSMRVKIDNPELRILVGMSASVKIAARTHNDVVVVKQNVVVEESDKRAVFVAHDGEAKKRSVVLGATEGDRVVISSGIEAGESLIVMGQRDLIDGQPIQIVQ